MMTCFDRLVPLLFAVSCSLMPDRSWGQQLPDNFQWSIGLGCNSTLDCHGTNVTCRDSLCECDEGYHFELENNQQICTECSGIHESCSIDECCFPHSALQCHLEVCQCRTDLWVNPPECSSMDQFKLATQIALGSAIVLAIACLLAILWRTCKRRRERVPARRHRDQRTGCVRRDVMRRRSSSTVSVTSGQLLVAELMRHRPPGYYDRSHIRIEKPPTYEETVEQPLRYPLIDINATTPLPRSGREPAGGGTTPVAMPEDVACSTPDVNTVNTVNRSISIGIINPVFMASDEKDDPYDTIDEQPMTELHM